MESSSTDDTCWLLIRKKTFLLTNTLFFFPQYVRVDEQTDANKVWDLMTRVWKLKPPHLIISVTGGAKHFNLTPRLKEVFRKGLIKAALSTGEFVVGTWTGFVTWECVQGTPIICRYWFYRRIQSMNVSQGLPFNARLKRSIFSLVC